MSSYPRQPGSRADGAERGGFRSFGTVGIEACNSLLCCPSPRQTVLQKQMLPASKVRVPFPAHSPHRCPPPAAVIIIYAPKHPLSSAGGQDPKRKPFKDLCQRREANPPQRTVVLGDLSVDKCLKLKRAERGEGAGGTL